MFDSPFGTTLRKGPAMAPPDTAPNSSAMEPMSRAPLDVASRIAEALAFDDVLLVPAYSQVLPSDTDTRTRLTHAPSR